MAKKQLRNNKQAVYIAIIIAMVVGTGVVLVRSKRTPTADIITHLLLPLTSESDESEEKITMQETMAFELLLQKLEKFGSWPVQPGHRGRANPFSPL